MHRALRRADAPVHGVAAGLRLLCLGIRRQPARVLRGHSVRVALPQEWVGRRNLPRHGCAARQTAPTDAASPDALADALVALERNRAREERARQRERLEGTRSDEFDLLTAGIEMVWSLLRR